MQNALPFHCGLLLLTAVSFAAPLLASAEKVRVYILAGQSNMLGYGLINPAKDRGTLSYITATANDPTGFYRFLRNADNTGWIERDDVFITLTSENTTNLSGKLTARFGADENEHIGPELSFGCVIGDLNTAPILLVKTSWGGKSLFEDFRPPSSSGATGPYYSEMINLVKNAVANISTYVPGYAGQGYVYAGFGWHQGFNDRVSDAGSAEYEVNMANFIKDVRTELGVPELPFVIATTGMGGEPDYTQVELAQMKMTDAAKYPAFVGNVAVVDTRKGTYQGRPFWNEVAWSPAEGQGYHWNMSAQSYTHIGLAMADQMSRISPSTFPARLRVTGESDGGIRLRWVNGYTVPSTATVRIRRNGVDIAAAAPASTATYLDASTQPGTYTYELTFSMPNPPPAPLTATFNGGVTNLNMSQDGGSAVLTWDNNMTYSGLRVSRNGSVLAASLSGTSTTFTDTAPVTTGLVTYTVVPTNGNAEPANVQRNFNLKCPVNILNITANDGINPATRQLWKAGDQYRLVFATSAKTQARSTNISTYDGFVQNLANTAGLGAATWKVIGSTASVDARDHTATNPAVNRLDIPIVLIDGKTVIASNYRGLWTWDFWGVDLRHPINRDEKGAIYTSESDTAHTGTNTEGMAEDDSLGTAGVRNGKLTLKDHSWISDWGGNWDSPGRLYAMSTPLTLTLESGVPAPPVITEGNGPLSVAMDEDASPKPFTLTLNATDSNGDTLTWSITSGPAKGIATGAGTGTSKVITYVPNGDWSGSDSFTVQVSDGTFTDSVIVNVTVNPRNDPPVNTAVPTVTGDSAVGTTMTTNTGTWNDSKDQTPGTLTYSYQWQVATDASGTSTTNIPGANVATYLVTSAHAGKYLRVRITCTDDGEGIPATASAEKYSTWKPIGGDGGSTPDQGNKKDDNRCGLGSSVAVLGGIFFLGLFAGRFRRDRKRSPY